MNKTSNSRARRKFLAAFAGVGILLGLSFTAFFAITIGFNKPVVVNSPRQTPEVNTTKSVETPEETTQTNAPESTKTDASASPAPEVPAKGTNKAEKKVVDSNKRVTIAPKPMTTSTNDPAPSSRVNNNVPAQKSPTEGYIRPTVTFIGATSCSRVSDGWRLTLSWKISSGNFIGRFYGQYSGIKSPSESWTISASEEFASNSAPTGNYTFRTEGDVIEFLGMDGSNQIIDSIWMPDRTNADVTNLCR